MKKTVEHITSVINLLNEKADYAVLRNYEGLPDKNKSRDIDIIITPDSLKKCEADILRIIVDGGWKVLTYLNSDRLYTYVCARCDEDGVELVQWDFFIDTSVWGLELMTAEEFLKHKQFNGFLYCLGVEAQFLDKYLYNRSVGAQYPDKYIETRKAAEHSPIVEEKLKQIFGLSTVAECDAVPGRGLLKTVFKKNLKHPFRMLKHVICFWYTFIRNYICSNTGFSMGFTGPDGAGKTTVIDLTLESLGDVFNTAYTYYHFRPTLFGNLGEVAHATGMVKNVDRNFSDPHRGSDKGKISSLFRLCYYSLDYIIGYFVKVKTWTRITKFVIFDRYYTDIICDSRRSRIFLPIKFLYYFGKVFIPSLDYNILLTADSESILARKKELDKESIDTINFKIDYLSKKKGYLKVLNDSTPEIAVNKILSHIFDNQHKRNLKRLS